MTDSEKHTNDPIVRAKRTLFLAHLFVGVLLTVVAGVLNAVSIARVQLLHPNYPLGPIDVGPYMPIPPITTLHGLGLAGLLVAFAVFGGLGKWGVRMSKPNAMRLVIAAFTAHVVYLSVAILAYGWCLGRVSMMLYYYLEGVAR